jgi:hypothetical protein
LLLPPPPDPPARRPAVGWVRSVGSRPAAGRAGGGVERGEAGRRTDRAGPTRDARGRDRPEKSPKPAPTRTAWGPTRTALV